MVFGERRGRLKWKDRTEPDGVTGAVHEAVIVVVEEDPKPRKRLPGAWLAPQPYRVYKKPLSQRPTFAPTYNGAPLNRIRDGMSKTILVKEESPLQDIRPRILMRPVCGLQV
jgi:hypothetical protein